MPDSILEKYGRYGISEIEAVYDDILDLYAAEDERLLWHGFVGYEEILPAAELIWGRLGFSQHDVRSASQFAFLATRLLHCETIYDFITQSASEADQYGDIETKIDKAFNFLRGAEYSFAEPLLLVQDLTNAVFGERSCDYTKFTTDLSSWGLPGKLKSLEEFGVPAPIIQRLQHYLNPEDPEEVLQTIQNMLENQKILNPAERLILR